MREILNGMLASSLILSMGTMSFASELTETQNISVDTEVLQEIETKTLSSMSPEVASAYAGVIEGIVQKYGDNPSQEALVNETGLMTARLVDFDGDGVEEMYVSYVSKTVSFDDPHSYAYGKILTEEVWAYSNSVAKKVWSNEHDWTDFPQRSAIETGIMVHDSSYVLVQTFVGFTLFPYGDYTFYDYENGAMKQVDLIEVSGGYNLNSIYEIEWSDNGTKTTQKLEENNPYIMEYIEDNKSAFARFGSKYDITKLDVLIKGGLYGEDCWTYQNCLPQLQAIASQPSTKTATPSTAKVMVNGQLVNFGAYNIDGFNYYKLTDMSYALSGTGKQFEVTWDGDIGVINMKIGSPHIVKGGELEGTSGTNKIAEEMDVKVLKNSALVNDLVVYSIDGSSYFQLDKLKGELGIDVCWDGATSTITITT